MVQMMTLVKLTSICGFACVATMSSYQFYITKKAQERPYFKDAMEILRDHSAAKKLLGEPVQSGFVDALSGRSRGDESKVDLYVNVKGSKLKGELFINAISNEEGNWLLNRVELEMKDKAGGKVLIYDRNSTEDSSAHEILQ
ncbi:hypothetical protein LSTR_LSTR000117 [Laodelphax striatellus]|uniref:Cytochrome oxidase complex assembly protein 1 n=1 Tax=Laodelphax striatellus TaxID=195883 RepID=A0A482X6R5_LAOST|nr:hypothetical protein LSTR_LSTR000117 [Laodelphax striatellus]